MIRFIVFAALALAIATPAEAMSPPPLPQSDGIRADVGYRGVARGHRYGVARDTGLGATAIAGIGATATVDIAAMATADTATARIGPVMELSAAKCAGARCGAQDMFAVSGYIETPNALRGAAFELLLPSTSHRSTPSSRCFPICFWTATLMTRITWTSRKVSNGQRTARHGAAAPCDRAPAENAERIADQSARRTQTRRCAEASKVGGMRQPS